MASGNEPTLLQLLHAAVVLPGTILAVALAVGERDPRPGGLVLPRAQDLLRPRLLGQRFLAAPHVGERLALGVGEAADVAELDGAGLASVETPQAVHRLVEREEVDRPRLGGRYRSGERDPQVVAAALARTPGPGALHQDPAHDPGGDAQEMGAVPPVDVGLDEPQVRLVHQRRGLQGPAGRIPPQLRAREPPKLPVDEGIRQS